MQTHNWEYFPQEKHQPKRGWKLKAWIAKWGVGWGWIVRDLMASITFLVSKKSNKDWCIEHLTSVCLAPWWEQFQLMMASTQTPPHTNTTKCKYTKSTTHEHNEIHIHIKCMQTKTQNKHKHTSQTHTHKSKTNKDTNKQAYSYKHNKFTETHRCKWKKPVIKEIIAIPNLCNKNTMFDISLFFCLFVDWLFCLFTFSFFVQLCS